MRAKPTSLGLRRRSQTDAYVAAFTLPDFLNYIVAGGAASITFISIYTRFLAEKRDEDAQKTFSIIITVMTAVMMWVRSDRDFRAAVRALVRQRIQARPDRFVHSPDPNSVAGTDLFLCRRSRFGGASVAPAVSVSRIRPLIYNVFIILGGSWVDGISG